MKYKSKVSLGKKIKDTSGKKHAWYDAITKDGEKIKVRKPLPPQQ